VLGFGLRLDEARSARAARRELERCACISGQLERIGDAFERLAIGCFAIAAFERADGLHAHQRAIGQLLLRKACSYPKGFEQRSELHRRSAVVH
jgi:hypothetical protein